MSAEHSAEDTMVGLFGDICIANMGRPENVERWAIQQRLKPVTDAATLKAIAEGAVTHPGWQLEPEKDPRFVLSVRKNRYACVIWAKRSDPSLLRQFYLDTIKEIERAGFEVTKVHDETREQGAIKRSVVIYRGGKGSSSPHFDLMLFTSDDPAAQMQASLQIWPTP